MRTDLFGLGPEFMPALSGALAEQRSQDPVSLRLYAEARDRLEDEIYKVGLPPSKISKA